MYAPSYDDGDPGKAMSVRYLDRAINELQEIEAEVGRFLGWVMDARADLASGRVSVQEAKESLERSEHVGAALKRQVDDALRFIDQA